MFGELNAFAKIYARFASPWNIVRQIDTYGKFLSYNLDMCGQGSSKTENHFITGSHPLMNQKGQSLAQVMISLAIMGIVVSTFSTITYNQSREVSKLTQKLATADVQRVVTASLADSSGVCTYLVNNPPLAAFDPSTITDHSSPTYRFNSIPLAGVAGSPNAIETSSTKPASTLSSSVFVSEIKLTDLVCIPAPCTATTNQFSANLYVSFNPAGLVIPIAPLKFPISLKTIGTAGNQTISSCAGQTVSTTTNITNISSGGDSGELCGLRRFSCGTSDQANPGYPDSGIPCKGSTLTVACQCFDIQYLCAPAFNANGDPTSSADMRGGIPYTFVGAYGCPSGYTAQLIGGDTITCAKH